MVMRKIGILLAAACAVGLACSRHMVETTLGIPRGGMAWVEAGTVEQGCDPGRRASCRGAHVSAFQIMDELVTVGAYRSCVHAGTCTPLEPTVRPGLSNAPVMPEGYPDDQPDAAPLRWATVAQAEAYCKASELQLPSEAQWERARQTGAIQPGDMTELLEGWYARWAEPNEDAGRYSSRLVISMEGGNSYRYGVHPEMGNARIGFRCATAATVEPSPTPAVPNSFATTPVPTPKPDPRDNWKRR